MNKNITFSADENLIQQARLKASMEHSTLNEQFRLWLQRYANNNRHGMDYHNLMQQFDYAQTTGSFSRDEMNER